MPSGLKPSASNDDKKVLRLLCDAFEQPPLAGSLPDDSGTVQVARHHRLSPLLSVTCREALPGGLAESFRRDRLVTAARNLLLANVAEEVIRALGARGISTIVLKGLDYEGRLYGAPGARPTADVDILVPGEHRRAAFGVLDELGFEPRAAAPGFDDADYHEVAWTRSGVEVDLHLRLAPPARCRIDHAAIWAAAQTVMIGSTEARALRVDHAVVFHALHMAIDHFAVPAIYLVDLARLVSKVDDLDGLLRLSVEWRCRKVLATALALTGDFLPSWRAAHPHVPTAGGAGEVVGRYGGLAPLSRPRQLRRKMLHFDRLLDAVRYVALQSRRNLREQIERRVRNRTARHRLGL